jgi:PBP1b-binding outer membrane lipoprotein LpoB
MKNIAILLFFTLLLTSCGKPVEKTENKTEENKVVTEETTTQGTDIKKETKTNSISKEAIVNEVENVIALMKTNF